MECRSRGTCKTTGRESASRLAFSAQLASVVWGLYADREELQRQCLSMVVRRTGRISGVSIISDEWVSVEVRSGPDDQIYSARVWIPRTFRDQLINRQADDRISFSGTIKRAEAEPFVHAGSLGVHV